jgi:ATP-dependent DNA helicase MPH1
MVELFGDVPRLIPDHIRPECLEKVMEIQPYVRETKVTRTKSTGKAAPKRKRDDDPGRNIPPEMPTSFTSAGSIWQKFKKRKADEDEEPPVERPLSAVEKDLDAALQSEDSDEGVENGGFMGPSRRTQSEKATSTAKKKKGKDKGGEKGVPKRSKTEGAKPDAKKRKGKGKKKAHSSEDEDKEHEERPPRKPSEVLPVASDDDDSDMGLEYGTFLRGMPRREPSLGPSNGHDSDSDGIYRRPRLSPVVQGDVIDLSDTDDELPQGKPNTVLLVTESTDTYF